MASNEEIAAKIILGNRYLTLATMGVEGPWAAPLAYTVDLDLTFIFYSALESQHCKNIAVNSIVSGAIFDSREPSDTADGVQFLGVAQIVDSSLLSAVMQRYFTKSFPDPEVRKKWARPVIDFQGSAVQRFYRITPHQFFKPDPDSTKIDRRISLSVEALRQFVLPS